MFPLFFVSFACVLFRLSLFLLWRFLLFCLVFFFWWLPRLHSRTFVETQNMGIIDFRSLEKWWVFGHFSFFGLVWILLWCLNHSKSLFASDEVDSSLTALSYLATERRILRFILQFVLSQTVLRSKVTPRCISECIDLFHLKNITNRKAFSLTSILWTCIFHRYCLRFNL